MLDGDDGREDTLLEVSVFCNGFANVIPNMVDKARNIYVDKARNI
jgi:hypothetical protein